jgi:undecaprenyl-diphosphatase
LLEHLVLMDRGISEAAAGLRWAPLTVVLILVSAWWVKGPLYVAVAAIRDLKKRLVPYTALAVTASFGAADLASGAIKEAVDRPRPPVDDPATVQAAVAVPSSPSFPSGHATTTFAAATAIAILVPRLRVPALALAVLVGLSRIYLGVHYTIDVLAGAALGAGVGAVIALAARALIRRRHAVATA